MNFGSGAGGGGGSSPTAGPDLEQIETEQLAFQSAAAEDKLRLLPTPWPTDSLPPNTSSLLSVASTKGLLAAAGPDTLVIASTESVRQTFINESADAETKVKSYSPQASIQLPTRISQVAFSSDESCLVIAAEQGGGLAVYDTNALVNGGKDATFQLATDGESVRQLLPNPNPSQDLSRYFGIVTTNGKLLLADLKDQTLVKASNGSAIFYEGVSCACWSRLGKQIIAGLANGKAVQLDPSGAVKAQIPEPPQLAGLRNPASTALPITSIFWLETNDFLIIHTPINAPDSGVNDDSIYHLAHRDKQTQAWTFSTFMDPCVAFGERKPAHHFLQRLREWGSLSDMVILASTASTDIGLFTRSKEPLDSSQPVTETFTYTQPPDQRRAAMPMGDTGDTSPIGLAVDLSTKEKVQKPIPNDETLDESPVPLPALYVLNNEGMLSMWWIIYNESIRKNQPYPDLIAAGGPRPLEQAKAPQQSQASSTHAHPSSPPPTSSPFGTFGSSSTTQTQPSAFGSTSTAKPQSQPAFGQSSFGTPSTPAFGGTSSLGNRASPWGAPGSVATGGGAQFGKSTFGQPSAPGQSAFGQSSFGQVGGMGANKSSVWGTPSQQTTQQSPSAPSTGSVFGGNLANQQSPFLSFGGAAKATGASGFAGLGGGSKENAQPSPSPFASKPSLSAEPSGSTVSFGSFGSGSTTFGVQSQPSTFGSPTPTPGSVFGKPSAPASREENMGDDNDTSDTASTRKPTDQQSGSVGPFGLPSGGFKLGSTFKGDGSAKDDLPKPKDAGAGLFGKNFGEALGDTGTSKPSSEGAAWWSSGRSTPANTANTSAAIVKKEPGTENEGPRLQDIPAFKEPEKKPEEKKAAASPVGDAPLPPDPMTWKPKPGALPAPVPPGFESAFGKKEDEILKAQNAPSPPSPKEGSPPLPKVTAAEPPTDGKKAGGEAPLAGSPPVDLGREKFSEAVPSGSEAEGPEEGEWTDEGEEEGEGDEDEDDEDGDESGDDEQGTPEITDQKGLSAFEARLTPASPKRQQQQEKSTTPATDKKESYTPAGMPKAPVMFAPPQRKVNESPRSPSPIRSATSPLRAPPSFGSAQPPLPAKPLPQPTAAGSRAPSSQQVPLAPSQQARPSSQLSKPSSQTQPPQRIAVPPGQLVQKKERAAAPPRPEEPDAGELSDEEDARVQAVLSAPIEPTKDVPAFLAHQDYVASGAEKSGIGGQIERVYRDINSMVDTLALNARSMRGFVEGNTAPADQTEQKGRLELEDEEAWLLGESTELSSIIEGVEIQLEDGRLEDARGALEGLRGEGKELTQLRTQMADVRKRIAAQKDPEQLAHQHAAALPVHSQVQQSELRQKVQLVQKSLAKAEELLSVLRAELASQSQAGGAGSRNGAGVPSVEAVERTILKMTRMVEERSGDIDVLEAKIRRFGGPAALGLTGKPLSGNYEDDLAASMRASRLSNSSPAALKASRMSRFGSPALARRSQRASTPGSVGTAGTPGMRKSLFDVSNVEVEAYRLKKDARRKAMDRLKETLESRGPRVIKVGEA